MQTIFYECFLGVKWMVEDQIKLLLVRKIKKTRTRYTHGKGNATID
jgi:hypothetical protein